eukprot:gnl/TRDRNA2_/TRDRNA2_150243_c0_seq2.p1 gnl/TRDRNA2_/TRDRNA2_150243_c0~~gnl/TRDRNA2_/TRDRNA2_150243_c0_seq2.p1  ORF type:complete len:228 (+),score=23.51 gnl/TRDRNA2_/TRDRNA2_150243_c0_seq2:30-713(+)
MAATFDRPGGPLCLWRCWSTCCCGPQRRLPPSRPVEARGMLARSRELSIPGPQTLSGGDVVASLEGRDGGLEDDRAVCVVCFERPSGAMLACGHDHFCVFCVERFETCPLCREPSEPLRDDLVKRHTSGSANAVPARPETLDGCAKGLTVVRISLVASLCFVLLVSSCAWSAETSATSRQSVGDSRGGSFSMIMVSTALGLVGDIVVYGVPFLTAAVLFVEVCMHSG